MPDAVLYNWKGSTDRNIIFCYHHPVNVDFDIGCEVFAKERQLILVPLSLYKNNNPKLDCSGTRLK